MARIYKISGYLVDWNDYYGVMEAKDFEDILGGQCHFGWSEFSSGPFEVKSTLLYDNEEYYDKCEEEGIDPDDHPLNYTDASIEEYEKYFKE